MKARQGSILHTTHDLKEIIINKCNRSVVYSSECADTMEGLHKSKHKL